MENLSQLFLENHYLILIIFLAIFILIARIIIKSKKSSDNKLFQCTNCSLKVKKKLLCIVDESVDTNKKGKAYCQHCIKLLIAQSFQAFSGQAVMVHPDDVFNAYQFYTFKELPKYGADEDYIASLNKALPGANQNCQLCQKTANYSWYAHDFFYHDLYIADINLEAKPMFLCGKCLSKEFISILDNKKISLSHFVPPHHEPGLGKPWEY